MKPLYFTFGPREYRPAAVCDVRRFTIAQALPGDFAEPLSFHIGQEGSLWTDLIDTNIGVLLFSERVVRAFQEDGITGMSFFEGQISMVRNVRLQRKPSPRYFWGRALGLIELDPAAWPGRYVPIRVVGRERFELFHYGTPRAPSGYACRARVLETFRNHRITNVSVKPTDYHETNSDVFVPPFWIDVLGKKWPPPSWYPKDFVPHPNNLTAG